MMNKTEIKDRTLTENTAQAVRNHLMELQSNRVHVQKRWIWELLQNARDTSTAHDTKIVTSVKLLDGALVFQHNGPGFNKHEISHLIFHGSTKVENEKAIGQYGSGFLATHLLSPNVEVRGRLENEQSFRFWLTRDMTSVDNLTASMNQAWDDFYDSLEQASIPESTTEDFTTRFHYPIADGSSDAVTEGIDALKLCAPYVMAFNHHFNRIHVETPDAAIKFTVTGRVKLQTERLQEITVEEAENGSHIARKYILAKGTKASVAIPLEVTNDGHECRDLGDTPRLFLGFPLIGTESFGVPCVINSFQFTPTEKRDGVFLGQADDDTNHRNQEVIKEACNLHLELLRFAASSGSKNVHYLAHIPPTHDHYWLNKDWLNKCLAQQLLEPIRNTPAVLCKHGVRTVAESRIPYADEVEDLWDLLSGVEEFRDRLPRQPEATGWRDAIDSWTTILTGKPTDRDETINGFKLAEYIERKTKPSDNSSYGTVGDLQGVLGEGVRAVEWLNQLYQCLKHNKFDSVIRDKCIILAQDGTLDHLSHLHRDKSIDDKLKDIADSLDLQCRAHLRDTRLTVLSDEVGRGDRDNKDVIREIIEKLDALAGDANNDNPMGDEFAKASVRSLAWVVGTEEWHTLDDFPAFSQSGDDDTRAVLRLPKHGASGSEIPLAPVKAWHENLRQYSQLFPPRQILAEAFFEAIPDTTTWQRLAEKKLVRTAVITTDSVNLKDFLPSEPLPEGEHRTTDPVRVTDVVFLTKDRIGIMERVRKSQSRARLLWQFITEWLAVNDPDGLETVKTDCECGQTHQYFPAAWLVPVVRNRWVPIGDDRNDRATAQGLAALLRSHESGKKPLKEGPEVTKVLAALGVKRFDLMRELVAEDEAGRAAVDSVFTHALTVTGGDLAPIREFLDDMQNDSELREHLKERRERRLIVQENQLLGGHVETAVRKALEDEGFTVTRIHVGADLKIELAEPHDVMSLKLDRQDKSWLVEVKATRGESHVRMTEAQAREAVSKKDRFLLCIVSIESNAVDPEEVDAVKARMRFVEDIGRRLDEVHLDLERFKDVRCEITNKSHSGIQLEVVSGITRVRVSEVVWRDEGISLGELAGKINGTDND